MHGLGAMDGVDLDKSISAVGLPFLAWRLYRYLGLLVFGGYVDEINGLNIPSYMNQRPCSYV